MGVSLSSLAAGSLNAPLGLSLFTLVLIYIYYTRLVNGSFWLLFASNFLEDKIFSLSLLVFGGKIRDLCDICFIGDFIVFGFGFEQ